MNGEEVLGMFPRHIHQISLTRNIFRCLNYMNEFIFTQGKASCYARHAN